MYSNESDLHKQSVYISVFADVSLPLLADGLPTAAAEFSYEENKEDFTQPPSRGDSAPYRYSCTNVQLSWYAPEGPT